MQQSVAHRPHRPEIVEAVVRVKARVLRRDRRVDEIFRKLRKARRLVSPKIPVEEPAHRSVLPIKKEQAPRRTSLQSRRQRKEKGHEVEADAVENRGSEGESDDRMKPTLAGGLRRLFQESRATKFTTRPTHH